ncbi:arylacetamide deacetylase-like isoform X1 [Branchiostoma lanceolatum]|uniref:arylacetamide deacetylase-like isoform X1 n=2 Tax=Branchiostoma lanceolatum TaxID=7740 RepID=UPI0034518BB8
MAAVKMTLVLVALALFLAYYGDQPVPEGIAEPHWPAKAKMIKRTAARNLAKIGEYIGVGTEAQNFRSILSCPWTNMKIKDAAYQDGLKRTNTEFNGVKVRIYSPPSAARSSSKVPGLVFIHGGGWVLGIDANDQVASHLAKQLGAVVVSVDYRLAPEHVFPAAYDDSVAATKFFLKNAEKYNVDSSRIGITGDSAGGNLAAAVTLTLAKEKGLPKLKTQALLYPCLQAIDFNTPSYINHGQVNTLSKDLMVSFWLWYLNNDLSFKQVFEANNHTSDQLKKSQYAGYMDPQMVDVTQVKKENIKFPEIPNIATILDPRFAPLMADDADLEGLAPTYVMTCEYDVLKDDGVMYATRLQKAGVRVEHDYYEHGYHGFINLFDVYELAGTAMQNWLAYLKKNL